MSESITGILERITYRADDTGYTVARLKLPGQKTVITVVGRLPEVQPGESLELEGDWIDHRSHGRQFEVIRYRTTPPTSTEGIVRYLASGLLPGIGPVTAQRIADTFGPSTLDILDRDPRRLSEVKGLGRKKIAAIVSAWEQQRTIKELLLLGQDVGLSVPLAIKIFKQYADAAVEIIRSDPYRLAIEIEGMGFLTADRIAGALGIARDAPGRITAGLRYALGVAASEEGHCALPESDLIAQTARILELPQATLAAGLAEATAAVLLVHDGDLIYLPAFYHAETELAGHLRALLHAPTNIQRLFADLESRELRAELAQAGYTLTTRQIEAVMVALRSPVLILTGGPGTGKTTTVRAVLSLLRRHDLGVLLTAPTGRAARRLAEATDHPATTIHRTLEFAGGAGLERWGRNDQNPLDAEMIVVDETSMLDLVLAHHLVKAVRRGAHLLFVGDADQLPSVGPGAVLRVLLLADTLPSIHLDTIFRQAADSGIIANAHAINHGQMPAVNAANLANDFFYADRADPRECAEAIVKIMIERIPRKFPQFDPIHDVQVLAATHRGPAGVAELNAALQLALNPPHSQRAEATINATLYRVGDRVIQLRNNYDLDVSNGDLGILTVIDAEERTVTIQFDDVRTVVYQWSELDEVALAYAISVHKAQGSEYPAVIVPVLRYYGPLLNRALLYTAVTRARQMVTLVGDWRAVETAVAARREVSRITGLMQRMRDEA